MAECRWIRKVERWFDGESAESRAVERHVTACDVCAAHLTRLRTIRKTVETVAARETIGDPQFPAFMDGIRGRVERPVRRRHRGFWALASLSAAALIVAVVTFTMLTGGPQEALATEVESCSTELEGATVGSYSSEDGTATVWVSMPEAGVF